MPLLDSLRTSSSGWCRQAVSGSRESRLQGVVLMSGPFKQCLAQVALHNCYLAIGVFVIVVRKILGCCRMVSVVRQLLQD